MATFNLRLVATTLAFTLAAVAPAGAGKPADGEIAIGLDREKGTLYNQITVVEKTAQPINFLVAGLNGFEVGNASRRRALLRL
jgi:hypothetical protein